MLGNLQKLCQQEKSIFHNQISVRTAADQRAEKAIQGLGSAKNSCSRQRRKYPLTIRP
jgi:hypothetical protein